MLRLLRLRLLLVWLHQLLLNELNLLLLCHCLMLLLCHLCLLLLRGMGHLQLLLLAAEAHEHLLLLLLQLGRGGGCDWRCWGKPWCWRFGRCRWFGQHQESRVVARLVAECLVLQGVCHPVWSHDFQQWAGSSHGLQIFRPFSLGSNQVGAAFIQRHSELPTMKGHYGPHRFCVCS